MRAKEVTLFLLLFVSIVLFTYSVYAFSLSSLFNVFTGNKEVTASAVTGGAIGSDGTELTCMRGVVAYYPFEETVYDKYSRAYHGAPVGVSYSSGLIGKAVSFYGNTSSYIELPNYLLDNKFVFAISMWIKSSGTADTLFSVANSDEGNEFLIHKQESLVVYLNGYRIDYGSKLNDGNWHHIVVSMDIANKKMKVYVDGNEVNAKNSDVLNSTSGAFSSRIDAEGIVIGQEQDGVLRGFNVLNSYNGLIDEMSVFNRLISAEEVAQLYNSGKGKMVCETVSSNICTDSDGGKNYDVKGTLTYYGRDDSDYCVDSKTLS